MVPMVVKSEKGNAVTVRRQLLLLFDFLYFLSNQPQANPQHYTPHYNMQIEELETVNVVLTKALVNIGKERMDLEKDLLEALYKVELLERQLENATAELSCLKKKTTISRPTTMWWTEASSKDRIMVQKNVWSSKKPKISGLPQLGVDHFIVDWD